MFLKSADVAALNGSLIKAIGQFTETSWYIVHAMEESIAYSQLLDDAL